MGLVWSRVPVRPASRVSQCYAGRLRPCSWTRSVCVASLQVVNPQILPPGEGLPADPAAVWSVPAVGPQVSLQTLLPAEVSAAQPTAVRFLSCVDPFVDLHHLH